MFSNCGLPCGALILNTVFGLKLTNEIVANSTGYALLRFNLLDNPLITDSIFKVTQDCSGENALICYGSCRKLDTLTLLTIYSSQFLFGRQFHVVSH